MSIIFIISIFFIGIITGIFGAIVGSSLFILVPSLIFFGFSPHIALGTAKLAAFFRDIVAIVNYQKSRKISFKIVIPFIIPGIIGTIISSNITLSLSEEILNTIIAVFMVIMIIVVLIREKIGIKEKENNKSVSMGIIVLSGFLSGLYAGIFGGGNNLLIIFVFVTFLNLNYVKAVATAKVPNILFLITFLIIFGIHKQIDYIGAIPLVIGTMIGSYFGSKLALKKGNIFIKWLFVCILFVMIIKLFFFT